MICPICGVEMEKGELITAGSPGLFFFPKAVNRPLYTKKFVKKHNGIVLDGPYWTRMNETTLNAYACRHCKLVCVQYDEGINTEKENRHL